MMGENIAPKHVEPTRNNKLIYIVHLVGYFHSWHHDAWIHESQVKKKSPLSIILASSLSNILTCHLSAFINPLKPELNPICYLLALLGAHHFSTLAR